ncbi:MAG: nucleoside deaminase [Desulfotalea sp.]
MSGHLGEDDMNNLHAAMNITRAAISAGDTPFGAVVAGADGKIIMSQENRALRDRNYTKHAESILASRFCHEYYDDPEFRAGSTLYSSMEPCAMCMFTMFKSGIGRVVYGLGADRLYELFNRYGDWPRTLISSHDCTSLMNFPMKVEGPYLEEQAEIIVADFFKAQENRARSQNERS